MVISNLLYGECLESELVLIVLYSLFGWIMKSQFGGWNLLVFSVLLELLSCLQLCVDKQFKVKNGLLDCVQKNYYLVESEGGKLVMLVEDFVNCLCKNLKKFEKWVCQEGIECYCLYDVDLLEYNVVIDCYVDWVVVQEYVLLKIVDVYKVCQCLFDIIVVIIVVLDMVFNKLVLKICEWQKGKNQYQKMVEKGDFIEVQEYNVCLWVNFIDYLDIGLFFDYCIVCCMFGQMSKGKDFLNLFFYIGSVSVYVGFGGV